MFGYDLRLARQHIRPIDRETAHFKSQFLGVLEMVVDVGMMQQDFRGDAADVQAGPAQIGIFLDNNCLQAQFARANCRYVTTRAASNDCNIVFCHALSPFDRPRTFGDGTSRPG